MLAMDVNDDAGNLTPRGALRFLASKLAPTVPTTQNLRSASRGGKKINSQSEAAYQPTWF
ncbi:hypothetical protein C1X65_26230 [Pseudomonas sp. FW305-70]|nr:hypothetical protein C1X65_26230 [Pseudomonas sp. FW305-70]